MMKTVKGKVLTGMTTVALLAGGTAAFASTDAGSGLKAWYNDTFGKSVSALQTNSTNYGNQQVPKLYNEFEGLKADAKSSLTNTRDTAISDSTSSINGEKDEHIKAVTGQKEAISAQMASVFDGMAAYAQGQIDTAGKQATGYANSDLTKFTGTQGQAAVAQVENDLNAASDRAVADLTKTIAQAKSDLQKQLNAETLTTTKEIQKAVDTKIEDLRTVITDKRDQLVKEHQTIISNKAAELTADAKKDLDEVVAGINK